VREVGDHRSGENLNVIGEWIAFWWAGPLALDVGLKEPYDHFANTFIIDRSARACAVINADALGNSVG
tara:strand:+ start:10435 stop:10638 length:204 start_codon:yes stop_codon:yes gene_type:complete